MTSVIRRRNKTNVQETVIDDNSSKKGPVLQENTCVGCLPNFVYIK